jgi:hypothetical protein
MSDQQLRAQGMLQGLRDSGAADPGSAGGGLVQKLGGPKPAALLAAGATVALVGLLSLRKKSTAKASDGGSQIVGAAQMDSTPYDLWNGWQSEYEALQAQINALHPTPINGGGVGTVTMQPLNPITFHNGAAIGTNIRDLVPARPVAIAKPPIPTRAPIGSSPAAVPRPISSWDDLQ